MAPLCSQSLRVIADPHFFHILHLSTVRGRIRQRETRVQVSQSPPLTSLDWRDMETSLLKQYTSPFLWQSSTSIHIRQSMQNTQVCNHGCRPTEVQLVPLFVGSIPPILLKHAMYRLELHELHSHTWWSVYTLPQQGELLQANTQALVNSAVRILHN